MPSPVIKAWLGTLPDVVKVANGRSRFYVQSCDQGGPPVVQAMQRHHLEGMMDAVASNNAAGVVVGVAELIVEDVYHDLLTCTPIMRAQHQDTAEQMPAKVAGSVARALCDLPPLPASSLLSLNVEGTHDAAYPIWLNWQLDCHPLFKHWFEMMWELVTFNRR